MEAFTSKLVGLVDDVAATEALLNKQFSNIDTNGDGQIDKGEIVAYYMQHVAGADQAHAEVAADKLLQVLDVDGDHHISRDEYLKGMKMLQAKAAGK